MGGQPAVIVTDEERAIHAAIEELQTLRQFSGIHLYDAFHILHNVKKKLTEKEHVVLFSRILHAKNTIEY